MFSFMLFIFLCFLGILAVLFYMLRSQERLCQTLRDEHAHLRLLLRAVESRLNTPDALQGASMQDAPYNPDLPHQDRPFETEPQPSASLSTRDPLLRLSFDAPASERPAEAKNDPALDLHFDPSENDPPRR